MILVFGLKFIFFFKVLTPKACSDKNIHSLLISDGVQNNLIRLKIKNYHLFLKKFLGVGEVFSLIKKANASF
jgi:hypothetical protein